MDIKVILLSIFLFQVVATSAWYSQDNTCGNEDSVRLRGRGRPRSRGRMPSSGRVEVCIEGEWHTMCDQFFNTADATVVCRELGFSDNGARPLNRGFPSGAENQRIWRADTLCNGTEESILDCFTLPQIRFCNHVNDVGVSCQEATNGELRILGGPNVTSGRIEVFDNMLGWGTICDDFWSRADAEVACRQLGFSSVGAQAVRNGFRQRSTTDPTPILLDNLVCNGDEDMLINCRHNGIGINNCDHTEDAGIVCRNDRSEVKIFHNILKTFLQELMTTAKMENKYNDKKMTQSYGAKQPSTSQDILDELKLLLEE